jgi:hypothetical protein
MSRFRSVILVAAALTSLLACGGAGTRAEPAPVLGPYALIRANSSTSVRAQGLSVEETRATAPMFREATRMCDLRKGRGAC